MSVGIAGSWPGPYGGAPPGRCGLWIAAGGGSHVPGACDQPRRRRIRCTTDHEVVLAGSFSSWSRVSAWST